MSSSSPLSPDVRQAGDATSEKATLRARFRAWREGLDSETYAQRSEAIVARIQALPELETARTVHIYWPLVARGEIDTRPLIRWLTARDKVVVLPVVIPSEADVRPGLRHVRYRGEAALRTSPWGVREPAGDETVPINQIDAVVVPALGADRKGHRIGYGQGFYDAFLAQVAAPRIGLVYADLLVDVLPTEPHDVALSMIVTENETIRLERRNSRRAGA